MLETFQRLIASQYEASLCTLAHCVAGCPSELWNAPVAKHPFCQVAFHVLFFADYYLEPGPESLPQQPFHLANPKLFGDYEQLQDREAVSLYERSQIETLVAWRVLRGGIHLQYLSVGLTHYAALAGNINISANAAVLKHTQGSSSPGEPTTGVT